MKIRHFCCIFADSVDTERDHNCFESQGMFLAETLHATRHIFFNNSRCFFKFRTTVTKIVFAIAADEYLDISLTFPSIYISFFTS